MLARVFSSALVGVDAYRVTVEADLSGGLPGFSVVGLPDASVRESRERVAAAVKNSGYQFPARRITINLAPADVRKEGALFDLPIALGLLVSSEQMEAFRDEAVLVVGELSLDGRLRPVRGVLSMAMLARRLGLASLLLPPENAEEAAIVEGVRVFPVRTLREAAEALPVLDRLDPHSPRGSQDDGEPLGPDLADVRGQEQARRAVEVAAAGGHNLLFVGPPGSGKTMIARRIPSILPELARDESLDVTRIYSVAGLLPAGSSLVRRRPFRAPHHSTSDAGLVGGGVHPRPGEVSLAHHGVLFLDELPEFKKNVLELLRQPLEEGCLRIARATVSVVFPSAFMLAAAMNPCPCGYWGDARCTCTPGEIQRYAARVSGPLLDRIDIHIEVPRVGFGELSGVAPGEASSAVRGRVERARLLQQSRFSSVPGVFTNARMETRELRRFAAPDEEGRRLLRAAMEKLGLSARAHDRILRVARTIADLDASDAVRAPHLAEAIQYRSLDRPRWREGG